ncbi:MAG: sulfurtransferase TusA family protein [Proteobacteria bacterium]|nr:sulfurtransferase TusA family protein [Pseudomonadota bacterium]MBU1713348.1 sulfurtransferase TusA family protein [Pseudomonadota bacterium]
MDLKNITPDETLDVRGLSCPMPTLKTAKAMKSLTPGQIIEVLGTDPGTKKDMPKLANKSGNEWLGFIDDEGFYRFYLRKGEGPKKEKE